MSDDEERRKAEKPDISASAAALIASVLYDKHPSKALKQLDSYDDCNFYVPPSRSEDFPHLLKIHNGVESDNVTILEAQDEMMKYLVSKGFTCSSPIESVNGRTIEYTTTPQRQFAVRMLTWVEGTTLNSLEPSFKRLLSSGQYLGRLRTALDHFDHPGCHRDHLWDVRRTSGLRSFFHALSSAPKVLAAVTDVVESFESIQTTLDRLQWGTLQADFNDANIIFDAKGNHAIGVIDFGDIVYSNRINDVAIAMAYSMLQPPKGMNRQETAAAVLQGYCETTGIDVDELEVLRILVACRLATSVTLGAFSMMQDTTGNAYLELHAKPGREALCEFWNAPEDQVCKLFNDSAAKGQQARNVKTSQRKVLLVSASCVALASLFSLFL